ncbi:MAG: flagella basal body P-ring formation protein FlgA [Oceanospirillaceae bacterium]|jgi:flagella basal body P-ring formation protein FlgA
MMNLMPIHSSRQGLAAQLIQPKWLLLAIFLWLITATTHATQWQPHKDIYQAINQFSQQQLGGHATSTKLDERSRYPLCKTPLQVTLPFNNDKTVEVTCPTPLSNNHPSWSLYLSINVQTNTQAWRLTSAIAEQGTINANQVALVTYTGTGTSTNYIGSEANPVGQQVKRHLSAGHWLSAIDFSELQVLWRAAQDIPQGQVIAQEHLTSSKESIRTSSPNVITNKTQLLGQLARRYIKAGKLLDKNDIEGQQHVVVSSQALAMGREIISQDLTMAWMPSHKLRQAGFKHQEALVGWVTKRHIASGTPLTQDMLRQAYLVVKGGQVSLQINVGSYQITNQAQALSNGSLGDKIDVKVIPSGLVKSGIVIAKGQVELAR